MTSSHLQTEGYLNRLLDETWLGNAHATAAIDSITRIRDANGNLTDVTQTGSEAGYSRTIGYDNLDRPTHFVDSRGFNVGIGQSPTPTVCASTTATTPPTDWKTPSSPVWAPSATPTPTTV